MDAFGRRERFRFGDAQLPSDEPTGRVDIDDTFESQKQISAMRTDPRHSKPSLLGIAGPEKRKSGNEAFGEGGQRFDRELALEAMRASDHTDEKK